MTRDSMRFKHLLSLCERCVYEGPPPDVTNYQSIILQTCETSSRDLSLYQVGGMLNDDTLLKENIADSQNLETFPCPDQIKLPRYTYPGKKVMKPIENVLIDTSSTSMGSPLHVFPNPKRFPDRFKDWVKVVGNSLDGVSDSDIYKLKRVCGLHFLNAHKNRLNRLNVLAFPTLHLPSSNVTVEEEVPAVREVKQENVNPEPVSEDCINDAENTNEFKHKPFIEYIKDEDENDTIYLEENSNDNDVPIPPLQKPEEGYNVEFDSSNNEIVALKIMEKPVVMTHAVCENMIKELKLQIRELKKRNSQIMIAKERMSKIKDTFKLKLQTLRASIKKNAFEIISKNMSLVAKQLTRIQMLSKVAPKGRRYTYDDKMLCLAIYYITPLRYKLLAKMLSLISLTQLRKEFPNLSKVARGELNETKTDNINNDEEQLADSNDVVNTQNPLDINHPYINIYKSIKNNKKYKISKAFDKSTARKGRVPKNTNIQKPRKVLVRVNNKFKNIVLDPQKGTKQLVIDHVPIFEDETLEATRNITMDIDTEVTDQGQIETVQPYELERNGIVYQFLPKNNPEPSKPKQKEMGSKGNSGGRSLLKVEPQHKNLNLKKGKVKKLSKALVENKQFFIEKKRKSSTVTNLKVQTAEVKTLESTNKQVYYLTSDGKLTTQQLDSTSKKLKLLKKLTPVRVQRIPKVTEMDYRESQLNMNLPNIETYLENIEDQGVVYKSVQGGDTTAGHNLPIQNESQEFNFEISEGVLQFQKNADDEVVYYSEADNEQVNEIVVSTCQ